MPRKIELLSKNKLAANMMNGQLLNEILHWPRVKFLKLFHLFLADFHHDSGCYENI